MEHKNELIERPATGSGTYKVHESSYVDEGASVGEGTRIWHFSHIMSGAVIGTKCSIGQNVNVGGKAVIGNGVKIQNNVSVYDDVIIEDEVFCGPSMVFTNVINPRAFRRAEAGVQENHGEAWSLDRCERDGGLWGDLGEVLALWVRGAS